MNDRPESVPAPEWSRAEIELSQLDLRYEGHRLRQRGLEDRLLASIAREGTAPVVVRAMHAALERLGFTHGRILEPALGLGHHRQPTVESIR